MPVTDPIERREAERLYVGYAAMGRRRRRQRRVRAGVGVALAATLVAVAAIWVALSLSGLNRGDQRVPATPPGGATLSAGGYDGCAVTPTHGVACWGMFGGGRHNVEYSAPVRVRGLLRDVTAVSAGWGFACATRADGGVSCWGANDRGQLGPNSRGASRAAVPIDGLPPVAAVSSGGGFACAVALAGDIWCWGSNTYGQLGDGTSARRPTPAPVVGLDAHATQVVTGFRHACALLVTGAVRCWGSNEIGQIGDGSQVDRSVPTPVSALPDDVIALSSSSTAEHTCALTSSGAVFCWGRSTAGMIGDGRLADPVATPVSGLPSGIRSVAVGEWNTCVVTTDRVSCWGSASQGALQQEPWRTGSDARRPQRLPYLPTDVAQVSVGGSTICALTLTGDLSCWGNNAHGELGAGLRPMTYRLRPQEVAGAWLAPV